MLTSLAPAPDLQYSLPVDTPLRNFLEQRKQCAFIVGMDGQTVFANRASHSALSACQTEADSDTSISAHPILARIIDTVLETGECIDDVMVELQAPGGDATYKKLDCVPWLDEADVLNGYIFTAYDVTEAYKKELELAESRNLLQLVLEHMPARIFWKDLDLAYLGCNTVFANDMGFELPEQLIGQDDFVTTMTREEAIVCRGDDFQVIESQEGVFGSEEVIGVGEDKAWIRVSKVPLHNASGESIGVLGMYEGIDEQKKAQFDLEEALRLERQLGELKTKFISTVAHEYRNPLATILATSDALIHIGDRFDVSKRRVRLEKIKAAVKRMTLLMDDVLFIGREGLMDGERNYEAINIRDLCTEAIGQVHVSVEGSETRIDVSELGQPFPLIGLPNHVLQMVQNLLENGLKYSDQQVKLVIDWKQDGLELRVADSGIGISNDEQNKIFNSFFRGENVGMEAGTGLGLYIVKQAVDLHNGSIALDSEAGKGSTFSVKLPYKPHSI